MWKGRFEAETSDLVQKIGESISFDWRLFRQDIRGSIAHSKALLEAEILTADEQAQIEAGLLEIGEEIESGDFEFKIALEDIHMNIESRLTEKIGAPGAKLHTARSRNDQIATDIRLYCREEIDTIREHIAGLQSALVGAAERHPDAVVPGYTHLQRGQPVLFAHQLLAYVEMLERDTSRLVDCRERLNVMPLGSGALAGSTIVLDRELIAAELDFPAISQNSMDAVSDRDFIAEILFDLALSGIHLSRLSEDVILWASAEFNFVQLSDAHTTGSSLMPQKKNPDVAELTRGKSGRLLGNLTSLLVTLKGLPMTYNRDLQEDKEPLFDSIDTAKLVLAVFAEMIDEMKINEPVTAAAAADPFLLATDIADYLVLKAVPFRQAHEICGLLTAFSIKEARGFPDLTLPEFREYSDVFEDDVFELFDVRKALEARKAVGAPSPENVACQVAKWREKLS
ncbi:MAG: argininosuccinate lyase [Verrucomicrobiales bacterium]|jgi:argininosuccinate lyase